MGNRLDDIARDIAGGMSRRQALLRSMGALGAAAVATLIPGRAASAQSKPEIVEQCLIWCTQLFGPNGPFGHYPYSQNALDLCRAEATMGQGFCFTFPGYQGAAQISPGPGYAVSCKSDKDCFGKNVCCNGKCCKPDLCASGLVYVTVNGKQVPINSVIGFTINSTNVSINGRALCIGC